MQSDFENFVIYGNPKGLKKINSSPKGRTGLQICRLTP